MKILYFKSSSGDDQRAICIVDVDLNEKQKRDIVIKSVGDDYVKEEDYLYGYYWIEDIGDVKASELLKNIQ